MTSARILQFPACPEPVEGSGRTEARRLPTPIPPMVVQAAATARLTQNGYVILYHHGQVNHCPGCGKSNWIIGNRSAECAFCATALDLQRLA